MFNLLKEEVEEIEQQSKSFDSKSRGLEQKVEILKNPNEAYESILA